MAPGNYFLSALSLWITGSVMLFSCWLWTESRAAQHCRRCQRDTPPYSKQNKTYLLHKLKRITEWFVLQLICRTFILNFPCQSGALVVHKMAYCCSPRKWKEGRLLENTLCIIADCTLMWLGTQKRFLQLALLDFLSKQVKGNTKE